jgi:molybdopterin-guanine dinucleotide biosynthesis protein A
VAKFRGEELVRRAVATLAQVADGVLFVATGPRRERLPGTAAAVCIADAPPHRGPLGGIAAALERTRGAGIVVLACDLPLVRPQTLREVVRVGRSADRPAAVRSAGGWEPLIAYWPRWVYKLVRAALWRGSLAPHQLLDRLGALGVGGVDPVELRNVNTPADLDKASSASWRAR